MEGLTKIYGNKTLYIFCLTLCNQGSMKKLTKIYDWLSIKLVTPWKDEPNFMIDFQQNFINFLTLCKPNVSDSTLPQHKIT